MTTPKFDFARAKSLAAKQMKNPLLEAIILGASGAGKSYCIGTLGVKTLYLYGTRESHGPQTAAVQGDKNIVPMCFDHGVWPGEKEPRPFSSDESMVFIESALRDFDWIKQEEFKAVAFDGMAVLEALVKDTTEWREKCKTAAGKHNTFKETEASVDLIGRVIGFLKGVQRECGTHLVATGIIDVKDTDQYGGIVEASPRLQGYGLAESLNQHFGDVLVVGRMSRDGQTKYKFQFLTDLVRTAKDEHGNQKRAMNFSPRMSGCEVPPMMDADLSQVAKLKREKMK